MTPLKHFVKIVTSLFSPAPVKKKRGRKLWVPPQGVDWSRPACHIAKDCGITTATVTRYMRSVGLPVRKKGLIKGTILPRTVDPSSIDWRYRDGFLGRRHGVTRERIRQLRRDAGLPPSGSAKWLAQGGIVNPKVRKRL